ncbi:MAG TPA: DCC1-like thiol-disulfide oxidoreductase family protein [Thermoleophilaceae bacterium]|nr:DCC1-like thiol-disulfide oxidoreductase family protein [Thermoleophilaceae bacterium]
MTATPILYDPDCGFCRVCVAVVLRWDRESRLRPVPGENLDSWQLVLPDGTALSAGAAFPPLFRLLPGGAPLARLTDRFPGPADRAYRWVADHRSALGRPIPGAVKRWADRVISESAADSR